MTLARRTLLIGLAAGAFAAPSVAALAGVGLNADDRVAIDPLSGLAIFGFDPVSYHLDGRPRGGRAGFEFHWSGAWWRFASEGNRAAFSSDPERFAPAFGGFDGAAVIAGLRLLPDPDVYLLAGHRLVLFRSPQGRDAFAEAGGPDAADRAWRALAGSAL